MKRILTAAALVVFSATLSMAAGITNTKHDLSSLSTSTLKAATQTQICVFCHTPHNAVKNVPLWNRSGGTAAASFKLYTSSGSLTQAKGTDSALHDDSISLFCLSCHDGTVANLGDRVVRPGAIAMAGGAIWTGGNATTGPAMLGSDLTNDHPIGFAYPSGGEANRLKSIADALTDMNANNGTAPDSSSIFFSSNAGAKTNQMECASCHMVHDNTNAPFLRSSNDGSKLCLACHIK